MKKFLGLCAVVVASHTALHAVSVGDTYSTVIAEKGKPTGKMEAGPVQMLQYPDMMVKLKNGTVTFVETTAPKVVLTSTGSTTGAPAVDTPKIKLAPLKTTWTSDFKSAQAQAHDEKRRVFLFFTGSDWCVWCNRLQKEVLGTPEFAKYAQEKLVLVEVDFPKSKLLAESVRMQNTELAKRFQIEGYPTAIVLDGNGKTLGTLGYLEGGPANFIERLEKM